MNESYLKINKIRKCINIVTAAVFLLFSAYHTYLFFQITTSRPGRLLGIISFLCLAFAAMFTLIPKRAFRKLRTVLMIGGLVLNFSIRLFNAGAMFGLLNFAYVPSVLNCAVYVFSQLAELLLLVYYVFFRHNKKLNSKRKFVIALMSFVIVLYIACFVMECVLLIKYRINIDLSRRMTVISRILYCIGFVSIAVNFMLPVHKVSKSDDFTNQPTDDELLFSSTESSTKKPDRKAKNKYKQKRLPNDYDNDFVL